MHRLDKYRIHKSEKAAEELEKTSYRAGPCLKGDLRTSTKMQKSKTTQHMLLEGTKCEFLKTPSTPGSDVSSNSPASISCNFGFQNVQANNTSRPSSAQRQYKPSLSPAMNSLRLLSVKPRY
ncbi:hypothetical protein J6590_046508 [Homalodisca vitripennis]|nr:hypothetical protein J6590_046508 [Homalodisca vitripennis]